MSKESWSVGRYVLEVVAANGIDTVFGVPGVHNLELYRGIAATGLRHILVRHEQNAGFAADGFARASGRAAAACVISGPGVSNILTAIAQAKSDSVPMLVIASTPAAATLGKRWGVLHELDDQRALAGETAGTARHVRSAEDARDHLREAFALQQSGRQRPAYIEVPLDLLAESTELRAIRFRLIGGVPQAPQASLAEAAKCLTEARRLLIIAGGGARSAGTELRQLVETLGAYLITTIAGKGVVPESHPASLGASLQFREVQQVVAAADVVLAVGSELSETDLYSRTRLQLSGRLIRIDVDLDKVADHYAAEIGIWGDARASVTGINRLIGSRAKNGASGWDAANGPATVRQRLESRFDAGQRRCLKALHALRKAVPKDGMVFADMTQIAYLGNYAFVAEQPGTWFHPAGFGTLGYAFPAAIGAKFAMPGRSVVALAGDFGFQYTSQELATAVELRLSLPVVVWNNAALGQIRDDMRSSGIPPIGVTGANPDFQALARAYGAHGFRARGPEELAAQVSAALLRAGPTLIEAREEDFA